MQYAVHLDVRLVCALELECLYWFPLRLPDCRDYGCVYIYLADKGEG